VAAAPADRELGLRRARAAALLTLALPGSACVYQGEELGLPEVEDLPEIALQDPTWERSGHTVRGRDGCRVPIPWEGDRPPFGFTAEGVDPWLPQPPEWASSTVAAQGEDPDSTLSLYRSALQLRRRLRGTPLTWCPSAPDVLAFDRGPSFRCVVNLSGTPLDVAELGRVLLASAPCADGLLPDAAVWVERGRPDGA
jgi:alpha-glucosidase